MIGKSVLGLTILLRWLSLLAAPVAAQEWPTTLDESLDERHDAEIFRAVVDSMREWERNKRSHHRTKREVSKVCYEDVGCFEDTGPFSYLEMLPSPPKDVGTRFLVYGSRKARSIPMEVPAEDISDNANRAIDPELPTKVIVHGFGSSCDHVWVYEMRSALMTVHECNIVCVDWGPGSAVPNYVRAAANTRLVGRQLAKLIRSLDVPMEKVHMIGFSLGAHVAGFAGAELGNVSRITGLDPAGPLFESQDPRVRLDATDARFVDVIHSNGEQLLLGGLGSWQPMGHVDFYPNGGRMQTGCSHLFLGAVSDIIWSSAVEGRSLCNHRRAYKFFMDSVSPKCRFPAFPCERGYDGLVKGECFPCGANDRPCGDMGYYSDESPARGQLYLMTREEEPFCAHQYQVKVYNSRSERPAKSYGKIQVTVVGEGSFNETFAMTRKDEELLVGAILQKIVVPHPAITNLEAIEIKYTAYSGWISSGLVSWSMDKVAIVDSFGKTISVCKRGLILESGHPVYLPLFPGDCTVPSEPENATSAVSAPSEKLTRDKQGIGPFTKEQNYDGQGAKDDYRFDAARRGVGPFTKEHNMRIAESNNGYGASEKRDESSDRRGPNPWTIADISSDGDSNSLENPGAERGRGFSGASVARQSSPSREAADSTTETLPEIREPVLRPGKKETGRSLSLPEITEPILRPRSARRDTRDDAGSREKQQDEIQETSSSSSRAFTVQFLPERLAGILAQAERYARQTLLPLISQYTPSFVTGARQEEPKYFPPLADIAVPDGSSETDAGTQENADGGNENDETRSIGLAEEGEPNDRGEESFAANTTDGLVVVEAIYPEKDAGNESSAIATPIGAFRTVPRESSGEWVPIEPVTSQNAAERTSGRDNASRSMNWNDSENRGWSPSRLETEEPEIETRIVDWVPITEKYEQRTSGSTSKEELPGPTTTSIVREADVDDAATSSTGSPEYVNVETTVKDDRKFIPLLDFEETTTDASVNANDAVLSSHIQKIPRPSRPTVGRIASRRAMAFPYAYERKKDPRTRYIPLIPEEDLGRTRAPIGRER